MSAAICVDNRFIFTNRAVGTGQVSAGSSLTQNIIQSQIDLSNINLPLDKLLWDAGANVWDENDNNIPKCDVDLTTDDKSALIELLS